jgi:hypothetical protein
MKHKSRTGELVQKSNCSLLPFRSLVRKGRCHAVSHIPNSLAMLAAMVAKNPGKCVEPP